MARTYNYAKGRAKRYVAKDELVDMTEAEKILRSVSLKVAKGPATRAGIKFNVMKGAGMCSLKEAVPSRLVVMKRDGTVVHVEDRLE